MRVPSSSPSTSLLSRLAIVPALVVVAACSNSSDTPTPSDSGASDSTTVVDSGHADSASNDTGTVVDSGVADSGASDTGTVVDSGAADSGTSDTGTSDTGTSDTGAADTGVADTGPADTGSGTVTLTIDNYLAWCQVTVNGTIVNPAAQVETVQVTPGTVNLNAIPLPGSTFVWAYWIGTAGDTSSTHDTNETTTVNVTGPTTIKACCPDPGSTCTF
jgi:hypothetical protein